MTIKGYAALVLVTSICLAAGAVAYSGGGIHRLLSADGLIVVFGICLPFFVLWGAVTGARGAAVPRSALAISIAFILLDAAFYIRSRLNLSGSDSSIVIAAIACVEMILSLLMVVSAVISRARWESGESNPAE